MRIDIIMMHPHSLFYPPGFFSVTLSCKQQKSLTAEEKAKLEEQSASARLDFLLKQTDLFSHFVKGNSALAYVFALFINYFLHFSVTTRLAMVFV